MNFELQPLRKVPRNKELLKWLPRWQSNNSPDDLGIIRFGFELFPHTLNREYGVPGWVRPALYQVLAYHPRHTKIDRSHAICTYREGAKSTWFAKILPLYFLLLGEYGIYHKDFLLPEMDYIRIRAKNEDDAIKKLDRILMEFTNPYVGNLFGRLEPTLKETKDKRLKNTSKFIILLNGYICQALGLNQPSRGANIKDRRPTLDIDDDVENKENTKSDTQRDYNAKEILGEQFGGLDKDGITIYIGNFVHSECIMKHLQAESNTSWTKQFHTATRINENGEEVSDWEERFSVSYWRKLEKWYENQPKLGGHRTFFMEYYNKIVSEHDYKVKYFEGRYVYKQKHNWIVFISEEEGQPVEKWVNCFIVVSLDPAISTSTKSSDGVVSVVAFCSDGQRRMIDCSLGKFDIRDRYHDETKRPAIIALTPDALANVSRKGGVEETVRKVIQYHANAYVIENAGQQLAWFNDVKDLLERLDIRIQGMPYHPNDEKDYKLQTGLLNWFAAGKWELSETMPFLKRVVEQIQTFPDSKKDVLDTLFNAEQVGRIPKKISLASIDGISTFSPDEESVYSLYEDLIINGGDPYVLP